MDLLIHLEYSITHHTIIAGGVTEPTLEITIKDGELITCWLLKNLKKILHNPIF